MEEQGIVQGGQLAPQLLTLKTYVSNPQPCSDCDSRFGIRNRLENDGWSRCETVRDAGVRDRCFNPAGTLEYFMLLKYHVETLEEYEDQFGFKHSQAKGYYESFLAFFKCRAEDPQRIRVRLFFFARYSFAIKLKFWFVGNGNLRLWESGMSTWPVSVYTSPAKDGILQESSRFLHRQIWILLLAVVT